MAHTPDMKTQVQLFVMRSRSRTADIQRRSSSNQTMDTTEEQSKQLDAEGWGVCLLREGPQQALDLIQLKILSDAKHISLQQVAEVDVCELVEKERQNLNHDVDFAKKNREWIEAMFFHKTLLTTQFKGCTNKCPPLLLQTNALTKRGCEQIKNVLKENLHVDGSNWYEWMDLAEELRAQALRNREVTAQYAQEIWKEQVAYTRTAKALASSLDPNMSEAMLVKFDQCVQQNYDELIISLGVPDTMMEIFSQVAKNIPYKSTATNAFVKP